ncbi:MAG: Glu-tRNA(Gln) amidotransferase subunit GatE [Candidatus Heimdallarchaeota archaeon]
MLELNEIDFEKIGFKGGLEVHHQIDTKRKLFCNCKPKLSSGIPDYRFERYFRPVLGEMGDFDAGMLIEYEKGYRVIYHAHEDSACIYEQDEQPPFWPDDEAIYKGFELAHWLNCSALVDEVVVSRKQYLDGSITTGFQRTMIVARDGWVPINGKKIRVTNLTVEEDAARKLRTENFGRTVYYNLDRLGIPLVEVITEHEDCHNPKDMQRLAEYIGLTLRLSKIAKRGLGSVRQDVNISIKGGSRVEIKGVQDLNTFDDLSRREVVRQDMLLKIAKILKDRDFKKDDLEHTYVDLTDKFDKEKVPKNYLIMGIRLPKFGELLGLEIQPGKDFGQDIIEKVELITGVPRFYIFHSDEVKQDAFRKLQLQNNDNRDLKECFFFPNIDAAFDKDLRNSLNLKDKTDAYFIAMGPQKWVIHAMKKITERAKMALDGVPEETRRFLPDNNTEFLRVIHGKDRLYPDTDTPPIDMDIAKIEKLKKKVGKRPWELEEELGKKYGLTYEQIRVLIRDDSLKTFTTLTDDHKFDPVKVYRYLKEVLVSIRRDNYNIKKLKLEQIIDILQGVHDGQYDMNVTSSITKIMIKNPKKNIKQVLSDLKIKEITDKTLERFYVETIKELQEGKYWKDISKLSKKEKNHLANQITGYIMRKANSGIAGKVVSDFVNKNLEKTISK